MVGLVFWPSAQSTQAFGCTPRKAAAWETIAADGQAQMVAATASAAMIKDRRDRRRFEADLIGKEIDIYLGIRSRCLKNRVVFQFVVLARNFSRRLVEALSRIYGWRLLTLIALFERIGRYIAEGLLTGPLLAHRALPPSHNVRLLATLTGIKCAMHTLVNLYLNEGLRPGQTFRCLPRSEGTGPLLWIQRRLELSSVRVQTVGPRRDGIRGTHRHHLGETNRFALSSWNSERTSPVVVSRTAKVCQ